jgi:hypothetical protein
MGNSLTPRLEMKRLRCFFANEFAITGANEFANTTTQLFSGFQSKKGTPQYKCLFGLKINQNTAMRTLFLLFFFFSNDRNVVLSQDAPFLKVHFLYGSKPLKKYKSEQKWFGGILGGHVGIESDSDKVWNFMPIGKFHLFAKKADKHGIFLESSDAHFYRYFGGLPQDIKQSIVYIPISLNQKQQFDSLTRAYLKNTPYDYALFGMRCGAATYEILGQLNIVPQFGYAKTWCTIIYPKKLRKQLFKKAIKNNWRIENQAGSETRKWETD